MTDFSNLPAGTKVLVEATVRNSLHKVPPKGWLLLTSGAGSDFGIPASLAHKCVKIVSLPETPEQVEDALRSKLARVTAERDAAREQIRRYREKEREANETPDARNKRLAEELTKLTGLPVTVVDEAHLDADVAFVERLHNPSPTWDRIFASVAKSFDPKATSSYRAPGGRLVGRKWDACPGHGRKEARQTKFYKDVVTDFNRSRELVKEGYKLNFGTAPDLPPDTRVHYVMRNGVRTSSQKPEGEPVRALRWEFEPLDSDFRVADIIGYKVVKGEPKFNADIPPPAGINRKTLFSHKPGDPCPVHPGTKVYYETSCGWVSAKPLTAAYLCWGMLSRIVGYTPVASE